MRIDRYVAVDDVGRVINPLIVDGQIHDGLAQGIGQALLERVAYDSDGQILTGSFTDNRRGGLRRSAAARHERRVDHAAGDPPSAFLFRCHLRLYR